MSNRGSANATKKHELSRWDAKSSSFPAHREDMQLHMSSYKASFILDARRALFVKYNKKREENKVAKT
eukprot:1124460-Rhodomonas_salina.1